MSGVEGYVESAASGLLAGIGAVFRARGEEPLALPEDTALGALGRYIARSDPEHYQPTNIAFGLLPELAVRVRDKAKKRLALAERALASLGALPAPPRHAGPSAIRAPAGSAWCEARDRGVRAPPRARAQRVAHTVRAYGEDLAQFAGYLERDLGQRAAPAGRRSPARARLPGASCTSAASGSRRRRASSRACGRFFRYLCREGRLAVNPARGLSTPRQERRIPAMLDEAQVAALLEMPGDGASALRGRAILELLYGTGIRCAEAVALDVRRASTSGARMVRVLGKGRKERVVPVRPTRAAGASGLARGAPRLKPRTDALFLNARGGRLSGRNVRTSSRSGCFRWRSPAAAARTRCATASRPTC